MVGSGLPLGKQHVLRKLKYTFVLLLFLFPITLSSYFNHVPQHGDVKSNSLCKTYGKHNRVTKKRTLNQTSALPFNKVGILTELSFFKAS